MLSSLSVLVANPGGNSCKQGALRWCGQIAAGDDAATLPLEDGRADIQKSGHISWSGPEIQQ